MLDLKKMFSGLFNNVDGANLFKSALPGNGANLLRFGRPLGVVLSPHTFVDLTARIYCINPHTDRLSHGSVPTPLTPRRRALLLSECARVVPAPKHEGGALAVAPLGRGGGKGICVGTQCTRAEGNDGEARRRAQCAAPALAALCRCPEAELRARFLRLRRLRPRLCFRPRLSFRLHMRLRLRHALQQEPALCKVLDGFARL